MATEKVPDRLDPNIELAAQAGDPAAMRIASQQLTAYAQRTSLLADQWLYLAAEAGDSEAMYGQAQAHYLEEGEAAREAWAYWLGHAAEAGWLAAMEDMVNYSTSEDQREFWLRKAAKGGAPGSMLTLADLLAEKGQAAEAERCYRAAMDMGLTVARSRLASFLTRQGRLTEAEQYVRPEAQAGSSAAAEQLAEILQELGQAEEAATWRAQIDTLRAREREGPLEGTGGFDVAEVATAALVTTAVVPFLQALAAKVAEDAYGQARKLVRRLLRRNGRDGSIEDSSQPSESAAGNEPGLAILQDPDAGITLFLWSNASDEALRALSSLNFGELTHRRPDQGQVHLVWHPASGTWHIRGS
ncbi:hypothetical protein ACWGK1_01120 [Streptomyces wedmorensis]